MLRAKASRFKQQGTSTRDKVLAATDAVGKFAGIPIIAQVVNATNRSKLGRKVLEGTLGVHHQAPVPDYHSNTARKRLKRLRTESTQVAETTAATRGKVVLYTTCYGNRNRPEMDVDLVAVFEHNDIPVALAEKEVCCGMPKLELGDLESVARAKEINIPILAAWVDKGYDIVAPIPSCTLMYKQELPLMFPDDPDVMKVRAAMFDPFEYLMLRHKAGKLKTEFAQSLGSVAYQVPCHLRVQNIGLKTRDALQLVPGTTVEAIERCSGHDGTYAVKKEFHEISKKIARPVINRVKKSEADHFVSDCPMAAEQITQGLDDYDAGHPMSLLRKAYGI
jgi:Fe-S oxidoreductase